MPDNDTAKKSRYTVLEKPDFKSQVPEMLLTGCSAKDRYLIEAMSRIEGQNSWLIDQACGASKVWVDLDVRIAEIEAWKDRLMSKWTLIALFMAAVVMPVAVPLVVHVLSAKFLK